MKSDALMRRGLPRLHFICLVAGTIVLGPYTAAAQNSTKPAVQPAGRMHGYVIARLPRPGGDVAMPDVMVTIVSTTSKSKVLARSQTDSSGRFVLPLQPAGDYFVCAVARGFTQACATQIVNSGPNVERLLFLPLVPTGGFLHGTVVLKDGSPAVRHRAPWATGGAAKLRLTNAAGHVIAENVSVNGAGQYVLAPIDPGSKFVLSVSYEAAKASRTFSLTTDALAGGKPFNVELPSTAPEIESASLTVDGKPALAAFPGSKVAITIKAKAEGPGALHYRWWAGFKGLVAKDAATATWMAPKTPSLHQLGFEIGDGYGGVRRGYFNVPVIDNPILNKPVPEKPAVIVGPITSICNKNPVVCMVQTYPTLLSAQVPQQTGVFIDPHGYDTTKYYGAIGATALYPTFLKFKQTFGFSPDPKTPAPGEIRAVYFNNGDLKFGRDMHCISTPTSPSPQTGFKAACYVSNYGDNVGANSDFHNFGVYIDSSGLNIRTPDFAATDQNTQDAIAKTAANKNRIATVAMIYDSTGGAGGRVDFLVYAADTPDPNDGSLLSNAVLDSGGLPGKAVPGVCMACHGGVYDTTNNWSGIRPAGSTAPFTNSSRFLPFDTSSFKFSPEGKGAGKVEQQKQFFDLNQLVARIADNTSPANTSSISKMINLQWYNTGICPNPQAPHGCALDADLPPAGVGADQWPGGAATTFYRTVPSVYCRGCHLALNDSHAIPLDLQSHSVWKDPSNFASFYVGSLNPPKGGLMPHAEVPFFGYWENNVLQRLINFVNSP